jgi:hypothetical protein
VPQTTAAIKVCCFNYERTPGFNTKNILVRTGPVYKNKDVFAKKYPQKVNNHANSNTGKLKSKLQFLPLLPNPLIAHATAFHVRQWADPVRGVLSYLCLLMRLDDGGLPGYIVDTMLTQCNKCEWVTTTRTFHDHGCMFPKSLFTELAPGDDDDNEVPPGPMQEEVEAKLKEHGF